MLLSTVAPGVVLSGVPLCKKVRMGHGENRVLEELPSGLSYHPAVYAFSVRDQPCVLNMVSVNRSTHKIR